MRRREFIAGLSGAVAIILTSKAQERSGKRLGFIMAFAEDDPEAKMRADVLLDELGKLGLSNLQIDWRWSGGNLDKLKKYAAEIVDAKPDVILTSGSVVLSALRDQTRSIPIVFIQVTDPVAGGFVKSLAEPGGNVTGFANYEYDIGGKWFDTLKEIAPQIAHILIIANPRATATIGLVRMVEAIGRLSGVRISSVDGHSAPLIQEAVAKLAEQTNTGLMVQPDATIASHRKLIISLANQYKLPAVYPFRYYAMSGGLVSYGLDSSDIIRRSASYIDRILKGQKPSELPVQQPTKLQLVVNLSAAKANGIAVPPSLLARADEVIE